MSAAWLDEAGLVTLPSAVTIPAAADRGQPGGVP